MFRYTNMQQITARTFLPFWPFAKYAVGLYFVTIFSQNKNTANIPTKVSIHKADPVYSRLVNSCTGPERIYSAMDIFCAQQYINVVYSVYFRQTRQDKTTRGHGRRHYSASKSASPMSILR